MIFLSTVQKVAKNTGIVLAGDVVFRLVSLVVIIYLARYLGTAGFGKYNFVFAYLAFFGVIADLGLQSIIVRDLARNPEMAPNLIGNAYFIRLILTVLAVVLSIVVITLMSYPPDTTTYVCIAAFTLLFISFSDFYATIFQANLKMEYTTIVKLIFKFLSAGLILWIIFIHGTLIQVMIALVFSEMIKTSLSYIFSRKFVRPRFKIDFGLWKYLFREALPIALSSVIGIIYFRIDIVMLSMMIGDAEVGLYSAAYKLSEPLFLIPAALTISLFPVMSVLFKTSKEGLFKSYRLSFKYLFIIMLPIAIGTTLIADKVILLIYGTDFVDSAIALKILIWTLIFVPINRLFGNLLIAIGKQKLHTITMALSAIGNIILNIILIPVMSFIGASIATVMTSIVVFIISYYFVSRKLHILPIHKIVIKPTIGGLSMCPFIYYLLLLNYNIFLIIFLAPIIYLTALLVLKTFSEEDLDIIKKIIGNIPPDFVLEKFDKWIGTKKR